MNPDNEGFLYPEVNKTKCIDCNLCNKICPITKPLEFHNFETLAFAAQIKDEKIRERSASGGVFSAIAIYVLSQNGVVFGGCYDENFMVEHNYVTQMEELYKLQSSKYVQSNMKNNFAKVKQLLDDDKMVLFSGTPCQVNGLHSLQYNLYHLETNATDMQVLLCR
jgi:coenzyme F420-reducing hydrogenase beta subunit